MKNKPHNSAYRGCKDRDFDPDRPMVSSCFGFLKRAIIYPGAQYATEPGIVIELLRAEG